MNTAIDLQRLQSMVDVLRQETLQSLVHDMRAPMTVMKGYLQLLTSGLMGPMPEEQHKLVAQSVSALEELILMTDNMLQAGAIEERGITLQPVRGDLDELIDGVVQFYGPSFAQRDIRLERGRDTRGVRLTFDPFWIKRVLHNLVWNAYKFTPDGGTITLRVVRLDDTVEISVQDTGRGIAADKMTQLFGKFQQCTSIDRKFGAGLGLWICRQVMEEHGGSVRVESTEGCGSRFTLSFPA